MRQTSGELKALETKLQGKKKLQRQVLAYAQTKAARDGLRAQKSEKARAAYRQAHESDFIIADAAARYFKAHGITKLPARKALQAEIEQLISEKDGLYNTYHEQNMSAVTTMRGTACYWTTGSLACASRAFPFPSCATGSVWLSCPLTGSWPQPSCAGEAGNGVPSAGRPLSPNPTGENTAPTAPGA